MVLHMRDDIDNKNAKGEYHGYQEWYWNNGDKLWVKRFYNNGAPIDYEEWYWDGNFFYKGFYI